METNNHKAKSAKRKAKKKCFLLCAFCLLLFACSNPNSSSPKFNQYYVNGEKLYIQHCSNCHQKDGSGLGRVYPPLDSSDYLQSHTEDVICLIKNGKKGELMVNGEIYNQAMPGVSILTDLEIAEIATYIYNTWSNEGGIIEVTSVSEILLKCDTLAK
jgi:cytochrome c551